MAEQAEQRSLGEVLRALDAETAPAPEAPQNEVPAETQAEQAGAEAEQAAESTAEPETAEPKTLKTLHDVADHLGVDVADLYGLEIPLGDHETVTLGKWKDEYQARTLKVRAEEQALTQARQRAEQETQARLRELDTRYAEAAALIGDQEERILAAEKAVNWQELRATDPAEYAARRQEHLEAVQALQGRKARLRESVSQWRAQQAAEQETALAKTLEVEAQKLLDRIPDWRDPEKAKKGKADLSAYLSDTYGYTPEQVGAVADHRLVDIVRKAMLYDQIGKARPEAKRTVKIGDKVLTPGTRQTRDDARAEDLKTARDRLRKTGSKQDFGRLLRLLGD
jgi:hypothetical protein